MEKDTGGDTSGNNGDDGPAAQDSVQSVSGVTEAGTSGNVAAAAGEKPRRRGVSGGDLVVDDVEWEVVTMADGEAVASSSPVRRAAARLGWLLLGFLAGAAVAAVVLLMMREESPVASCTVPT